MLMWKGVIRWLTGKVEVKTLLNMCGSIEPGGLQARCLGYGLEFLDMGSWIIIFNILNIFYNCAGLHLL